MSLDTDILETKEASTLIDVERSLVDASKIPYNNAHHIFSASQKTQDIRMGGSCLLKLQTLKNTLPEHLQSETKIITSEVGKTTHYAMVTKIDGETYYMDPFLWQSELMSLGVNGPNAVNTLQNIWRIKREPDENNCLFVVSLNQETADENNKLITHRFTHTIDYLPSPSALPLKPELPSFLMQIPDSESQKLYKLWFPKQSDHIDTIWTVDGRTGIRTKITDSQSHEKIRAATMYDIENLLGTTEKEMNEYFMDASLREMELSRLLNNTSTEDMPVDHNML